MGGPIVRTGTTPEFWKNWDKVFAGKKTADGSKKKTAAKSTKKTASGAAKKSAKKTPVKAVKKAKKK